MTVSFGDGFSVVMLEPGGVGITSFSLPSGAFDKLSMLSLLMLDGSREDVVSLLLSGPAVGFSPVMLGARDFGDMSCSLISGDCIRVFLVSTLKLDVSIWDFALSSVIKVPI